eukprot:CAMPEP_0206039820 /NCGR_PEP_ID=MMETSP1466-20131121/5003_1 /ASSEMBLY_ACC=CAM_ASM_001126 /TAXON_ID=44452 /ORGANISM="Pavlova gyrans, Strain CCMP608" /LENGTH=134 /DNA_ID=CAMNT_0053414475 /DNA_START=14 /DNA_END=418 /DNA_ORIENTATION=+
MEPGIVMKLMMIAMITCLLLAAFAVGADASCVRTSSFAYGRPAFHGPTLARVPNKALCVPKNMAVRKHRHTATTMKVQPGTKAQPRKQAGKKPAASEEEGSFNPLIYLVPWKNPNSIFVYFILFFYVVDFLKTH